MTWPEVFNNHLEHILICVMVLGVISAGIWLFTRNPQV